jgi:hypothetical protein
MSLRLVEVLRCEENFKYYTYHLNSHSGFDGPLGELWFSRERKSRAEAYRACFEDYLRSKHQSNTVAMYVGLVLTKQEFRYFRQAFKSFQDRTPELWHNYLRVESAYLSAHRRKGRGRCRSLYTEG